MIKVVFYIIDMEFDSQYEYEGYFYNEEEIQQFIKENEDAGNEVDLLYRQWVAMEDVPENIF